MIDAVYWGNRYICLIEGVYWGDRCTGKTDIMWTTDFIWMSVCIFWAVVFGRKMKIQGGEYGAEALSLSVNFRERAL